MIKIGEKELRNIQEQVLKNAQDIEILNRGTAVLDEFGIKVIGQVESMDDLPTVEEYKEAHEDWEYGDAYAVGEESPYEIVILTRGNEYSGEEDYWFDIGEFPKAGPQGERGEQGPKGNKGDKGDKGADGADGDKVSAGTGIIIDTLYTGEKEITVNTSIIPTIATLANYQRKLTAGDNITITSDNVISAEVGETEYYGGTGIDITSDRTISIDTSVVATQSDLEDLKKINFIDTDIGLYVEDLDTGVYINNGDAFYLNNANGGSIEIMPYDTFVKGEYGVGLLASSGLYYLALDSDDWTLAFAPTMPEVQIAIDAATSDKVRRTDYASSTDAGVIKVSGTYGFNINSSNGILTTAVKTYDQYNSMLTNAAISKGTLENVLANKTVASVNSKTGNSITLTASDINATNSQSIQTNLERIDAAEEADRDDIEALQTTTSLLSNTKQDNLVSGTNIKTINNQSLLGSGDITISGGGSLYRHTITVSNRTSTIGSFILYNSSSTPLTSAADFSNQAYVFNDGSFPGLIMFPIFSTVGPTTITWNSSSSSFTATVLSRTGLTYNDFVVAI